MVAVNAGGRKIADPTCLCPGNRGRCLQERIASGVRGGRAQDVRRVGKRRAKVAGPQKRLHPFGIKGAGFFSRAGSADDTPALRKQATGKSAGGIAVAKGKERGHRADYRGGRGRVQGLAMLAEQGHVCKKGGTPWTSP